MANVNTLDNVDVYAILNELHEQATGTKSLAPVNSGEFVSMATTTLGVSTDIVHSTLMSTIARTVFAGRPYNMKFRGIVADETRWGGVVRKITHADNDLTEDKAYHDIVDGQRNADMFEVRKGKVLATHYYGADQWQDFFTTFEDQLYSAFENEGALGSFIASKSMEMDNKWTQYMEELARGALANFIGAKVALDNGVVHLLTEYKEETGLSELTAQDIYKPEYVKPFFEFVKSRIDTLSRMMTERSELFQVKIDGFRINRHTPYSNQKIYLSAKAMDKINASVLSEVYHDNRVEIRETEAVNYWQNIQDPDSIQVTPSVIDSTGAYVAGQETTVNNIFGVIFDEDAVVINPIRRNVNVTPFEARGRYWNTILSANTRYCNDLTEKGIVLLLD